MDFFLSSDASVCSTIPFSLLQNFDHVIVPVSTNFSSNSQRDSLFHHIAYTSRADWGDLYEHLRDIPWYDKIKLSASAASEFCEWVQVEIDVYIAHRKYQVNPDSSPWFSLFCLYQQ